MHTNKGENKMYHIVRIDATKDHQRDVSAILGTIRRCRTIETARKVCKLENEKISNQSLGFKYLIFAM